MPTQAKGVTATAARPIIGQPVGDGFFIAEQIAKGGFGAVYVATHPVLPTKRAIKVLLDELAEHPQIVARFVDEARAAAYLDHPNIVRIDGFAQLAEGGQWYIKMEYLEGYSLQALLKRGPVPLQQTLEILAQVCAGLDCAHGQGIIHRDLKPANIYLVGLPEDHFHVKVLDFGIAKLSTSELGAISGNTANGAAMYTEAYAAPEQKQSLTETTTQTDIFSLGIIAWEMVTGKRYSIGVDPRLHRMELPVGWVEAIAQATALDPAHRQKDVRQFLTQIMEATPDGIDTVRQVTRAFLDGLAAPQAPTVRAASIETVSLKGARPPSASPVSQSGVTSGTYLGFEVGPPPPVPAATSPRPSRRWVTALGMVASAGIVATATVLLAVRDADGPPDVDDDPPTTPRRLDPEPAAAPSVPPAPVAPVITPIVTVDAGVPDASIGLDASPVDAGVPSKRRRSRPRNAAPAPSRTSSDDFLNSY